MFSRRSEFVSLGSVKLSTGTQISSSQSSAPVGIRAMPSCPHSVRELPPTGSQLRRTRHRFFKCFIGLDWVELFGVGGEFPLLTGGL
jgi:hypothetical protein